MKNFIMGVVVVGAVGGFVWWYAKRAEPARPGPAPSFQDTQKTYTSDAYHITFQYPANYSLEEKNRGDAHRGHFAIILTEKTDNPPPQGGEGPPAITVDIYQNNLDKMPLLGWLKGTNESNFKLSNGEFSSTTISGASAVEYEWDGLYEAKNIAFVHKDFIYSFAVTHLTDSDQIIKDFDTLMSSVELK
jgi:hypothetical protein